MEARPLVFVVDDDTDIRQTLRCLIESVGLQARTFGSAEEFLDEFIADTPGCLVVDVRLPGMSGLQLLEELRRVDAEIPAIVISAFGDVPVVVRAMRAGAVDFLEKPFSHQRLLDHVHRCLKREGSLRHRRAERQALRRRMDLLSLRQRQVLEMIADGYTAQEIARQLGLSKSTVYAHRAEAYSRIEAASDAEAAQQVLAARAYEVGQNLSGGAGEHRVSGHRGHGGDLVLKDHHGYVDGQHLDSHGGNRL